MEQNAILYTGEKRDAITLAQAFNAKPNHFPWGAFLAGLKTWIIPLEINPTSDGVREKISRLGYSVEERPELIGAGNGSSTMWWGLKVSKPS